MRTELPEAVESKTPVVIPEILHLLPVTDVVVFPGVILPHVINDPRQIHAVQEVLRGDRLLAIFLKQENDENGRLAPVGSAAQILKMFSVPDGSMGLLLQGVGRLSFREVVSRSPNLLVRVERHTEDLRTNVRTESYRKALLKAFDDYCQLNTWVGEDLRQSLRSVKDLGRLADLVSANLNFSVEDRQRVLGELNVGERAKTALKLLRREVELAELSRKIQDDLANAMDRNQKEYYLREQLKVIRHELGEDEDAQVELEELRRRFAAEDLPAPVREAGQREVRRLGRMNTASAEYGVARTYVDWLAQFPWNERDRDRHDVGRARRVLDRDHFGLEAVKERILEYIAVRKLTGGGRKSPILCFVGPPGVGKTSLGKSIAESLGRRFVRLALGGVHDESEIRGHRRTYVGSMPGRIVQKLRETGCMNPVFMLDEIDKLGADVKGDPSAALLEVLDPAQNHTFADHYLEVPVDLSQVMFIATANQLERIPSPLRDRMEIIQLPGYLPTEKLEIARRYLVPRQLEASGLDKSQLSFQPEGLRVIIDEYTREAGVRQLEQRVGSVARKVARRVAEGEALRLRAGRATVRELLGNKRILPETANRAPEIGVATGMAWTPFGGALMFIEATAMPGNGGLRLTGSLGEVMRESGEIALSFIRSHADELGVPADFNRGTDLHLHFPEGSTPKDGPSAGVAIAACLVSLLSGRPLRHDVAMTGELSLRGKVLPIGGLREKVMAAHRAGIRVILAPRDNLKDVEEIPEEIRAELEIHGLDRVEQALELVLLPAADARAGRQR
ncbi:MAG: endopeptidase La [Candidatus Delongbacteria bacterium]